MADDVNILPNPEKVRWPGSGSFIPGITPFGFYDNDSIFLTEMAGAANFAANHLGFPHVDIELVDLHFANAFEEATNEYASQVNQWNIVNNMSALQGKAASEYSNMSGMNVQGSSLPYITALAEDYGAEAGVGGNVSLKRGYINVQPLQQVYDLQELWGNVSESFNRMEIKKIFNYRAPAMARIYDPMSMTGLSYSNVLTELGFGSYSPSMQFLLCPIFEDLLRGQSIQFNDLVRKSAYSFELINNKLRIFPIPGTGFKLFFEYVLKKDKSAGTIQAGDNYQYISDFSNVPYNNVIYSKLNQPARQWIRKYFLACCKEILGCIRQKYISIPVSGNSDITLDGAELRSEAKEEKDQLITNLREMLEKSGKAAQMELKALEAEKMQSILKSVPLKIYFGLFIAGFIL